MNAAGLRPTPLEIATSYVLGDEPSGASPSSTPSTANCPTGGPLEALGAAVLPALARPPCLVSFSGGRDSSAVLALAAHVARTEGLPPPIPATLRFSGVPDAEESAWQEMVVRHVGLDDWIRINVAAELDFLGPIATAQLRRHGVLFPCNAYVHVPLFEHAGSGSLLTGIDGDAVFGGWELGRVRHAWKGWGGARPTLRDVALTAYAFAPHRVREAARRFRPPPPLPWLTQSARAGLHRQWAKDVSTEPLTWGGWLERVGHRRYLAMAQWSWAVLASDSQTQVIHPFLDQRFLVALAAAGGSVGYPDRTCAMQATFGDLLPGAVSARQSKAVFGDAFWGASTQAFIESWTGDGIDLDLVDADHLRASWSGRSDYRLGMLVQQAWLRSSADQIEQKSQPRLEGIRATGASEHPGRQLG